MIKVLDARFVTTAVDKSGYPRADVPEIAFVGRSNVGKSSMINALAQRKKLVRVSNTPGRTRTLNFFEIDLEVDGERQTVRLADLPGYGFAKVSKDERHRWQEMIESYLERRAALRVVVSIVDAEIGPTPEDHEMLAWLTERSPKVLVAATKIDRLNKAKRKPQTQQIARELRLAYEAVLPFSSVEKIGVEEAWRSLLGAVAGS